MDEVARVSGEPGGMDPTAFEDRHSLLHPQQRLAGREVRKDEAGPPRIARTCGEEFGEDVFPCRRRGRVVPWRRLLRRVEGRRYRAPAFAGERGAKLLSGRAGSPAGDKAKPLIHTTRNAVVLLLFLFAQLRCASQQGDSWGLVSGE
jgi:hypothetical protein